MAFPALLVIWAFFHGSFSLTLYLICMFGLIFLGFTWWCSSDDVAWCFTSVGFSVGSEEVVSGEWFICAGCKELLGVDGDG